MFHCLKMHFSKRFYHEMMPFGTPDFSCIQGVKLRPPGRPRRNNIDPGGTYYNTNRPAGGTTLWAFWEFLNFQDIFIRRNVMDV